MKRILLTLAALGTALTMQAKVVLPGIFGDNMVLQQQSEAQFWGKAAPGKKVTIRPSWSTQGITANVGKDGRWRAAVPTPEAGGPYTIELSDGERLTLRDVLIGEVWLAGGQSNMELELRNSENAEAALENCADPLLRFYNVPKTGVINRNAENAASWQESSPENSGVMSAVAYYFAHKLRSELDPDLPIGIVDCYIGGTSIT